MASAAAEALLFADLEVRLNPPRTAGPDHLGLQTLLQRVGANPLASSDPVSCSALMRIRESIRA